MIYLVALLVTIVGLGKYLSSQQSAKHDGRVFVGGQPLGDEADVPCPPSPEWIGPDVLCRLESAGDRRWLAARDAEGGFSELNFGAVVVPEGAYFVIGDMRTQSNDSRSLGSVPLARIEGRVVWGEAAVP